MKQIYRLMLVGALGLTSAMSAMDVVSEKEVTVIVADGETVVLSEQDWDMIKASSSGSIGDSLRATSQASLPGLTKRELEVLVKYLRANERFAANYKPSEELYKSRLSLHQQRMADLAREATDPNNRPASRKAAQVALVEEEAKLRELRDEFVRTHVKTSFCSVVFSFFLKNGRYRDCSALLKAADYLGVDDILKNLADLLARTVELLLGSESVAPVDILLESDQCTQGSEEEFLLELRRAPCVRVYQDSFNGSLFYYASKKGYRLLVEDLIAQGLTTIKVTLAEGEQVVLLIKDWDVLMGCCSCSIRELLTGDDKILPFLTKKELLVLMWCLNLKKIIDVRSGTDVCRWRQMQHEERRAELERKTNNPNLPAWIRRAAQKAFLEEGARYRRFKEEEFPCIVFNSLIAAKSYREYIRLLKAADSLGVDGIIDELGSILEGAAELLLNGENVTTLDTPSCDASQASIECMQLSCQDFFHELLNLPCIVVSKYRDFVHKVLLFASKKGYTQIEQDLREWGIDLNARIGDDSVLSLSAGEDLEEPEDI